MVQAYPHTVFGLCDFWRRSSYWSWSFSIGLRMETKILWLRNKERNKLIIIEKNPQAYLSVCTNRKDYLFTLARANPWHSFDVGFSRKEAFL